MAGTDDARGLCEMEDRKAQARRKMSSFSEVGRENPDADHRQANAADRAAVPNRVRPASCGAACAVVVVPDHDATPTAPGVMRSLGQAGIPVIAASCSRSTRSFFSRYVKRRLVCPDQWRRCLIHFARSVEQKPVLFACADEQVLAIHRYREPFSELFHYPFLESRTLRQCLDKRVYADENSEVRGIFVGRKTRQYEARLLCRSKRQSSAAGGRLHASSRQEIR
jgi:hypothetical protein